MRTARVGFLVVVGILLGTAAPVVAQDMCCPWPAFPDYGDGRDGSVVISTNTDLYRDMFYRDLTIQPGVTLNTRGYVVRVCGTLTNRGTITDSYTGGAGGAGGAGGKGHDPYETEVGTPPCYPEPLCTPGQPGQAGGPPSISQPGQNGYGGSGGGGGGGGGGAWGTTPHFDANGGNGGNGGQGGKGGGYVRIYAYRLDNRGVIHADGQPGHAGSDAPRANACTSPPPTSCAPEYYVYQGIPRRDVAGGGGGGGGGGAGGNGGTVEIYYGHLVNAGTIHAFGASGASGGDGCGGCCLTYGAPLGNHADGCSGGTNGGRGGAGEHRAGYCSGDGEDGQPGPRGADGTVSLTYHAAYCKINGVCYYDGQVNPDNPCTACIPEISMTSWSPLPAGTSCDDELWCNGVATCDGYGNCRPGNCPCPVCGCDEANNRCVSVQYRTIGGAAFTNCSNPPGSGKPGVQITVKRYCGCNDPQPDFVATTVTGANGVWQVPDVPCAPAAGPCWVTVSAYDGQHKWCYVQNTCPPSSCGDAVINIAAAGPYTVNFWGCCQPYDMNGDGQLQPPGPDINCFVARLFYGQGACCGDCCVGHGDCNQDGLFTAVGDLMCFTDCLYYGHCPLWPGCTGPGGADNGSTFTIGGTIFTNLNDPLGSGVADVPVSLRLLDGTLVNTVYTQPPYGLWVMQNVPAGTYSLVPCRTGNLFRRVLPGPEIGPFAPITIIVNEEHREENQNLFFLAVGAPERTPCDTNCDGTVNAFDIDCFVYALVDPLKYCWACPRCNPLNADINNDGQINSFDIGLFVDCLVDSAK
jgi:hypothetical protein